MPPRCARQPPALVPLALVRARSLGRGALIYTCTACTSPTGPSTPSPAAPWTAEADHYYYTAQSYRDAQGRRATQRGRHVRWAPASGVVEHFFDDRPVPGTRRLAAGVEPFPFDRLVPYVSRASRSSTTKSCYSDVAREARESMVREPEAMCARAVPGDTHRKLVIRPKFSGQTFKHLLPPVRVLSYDSEPRSFQVVVTGVTAGDCPKSARKIPLAVLAAGVLLLAQGG